MSISEIFPFSTHIDYDYSLKMSTSQKETTEQKTDNCSFNQHSFSIHPNQCEKRSHYPPCESDKLYRENDRMGEVDWPREREERYDKAGV